MTIKSITPGNLRHMQDQEALILQGCGGTWLSDYVNNRLGGFARDQPVQQSNGKPDCPLIGQDGNIFNLMACFPCPQGTRSC